MNLKWEEFQGLLIFLISSCILRVMRWGSALRANRELKNCLKTMELTKMIRLLFIARKV